MSGFLSFPLINSDRRQNGGDESDYDVLDHTLLFLHIITDGVVNDIADFD